MDDPDRPLPLQPDTVDLWYCADLRTLGADMALARCLTEPELARAARFAQRRDRLRFIARRALLRRLLAGLLGCPPTQVPLGTGDHGKPVLFAEAPIAFNATSCGDSALIALMPHGAVGIDLERTRAIPDAMALARQFFAPGEIAALERLAPADFERGFLRCWTCKEAVVKAWGQGLSVELDRFEIAFEPASEPRLRRLDGGDGDWFLRMIEPAPGQQATLVTDREVKQIRIFSL